jgi:hypothetical protein
MKVPPYMMICTHLSMNATSSSGVFGKKGTKDKIHISAIQKVEKGYFLR